MMNSIRNKVTLYSDYCRGVRDGRIDDTAGYIETFGIIYGKYLIKLMLEIKGKPNSTLVHTF